MDIAPEQKSSAVETPESAVAGTAGSMRDRAIKLDASRILSFRAVVGEDGPFLLEVYGSTRDEELALTNWDEQQRHAFLKMQLEAQHLHYRGQYPSAEYLVILLDGSPIGRLYLADTQSETRIMDLTVLPRYRGTGVGTALVKDLMVLSSERRKPLGIYVESFNRSLGLFERMGFVRSGENGYSLLMRWTPEAAASTA
jgi:ribosomal protein S18 acetylase RimI-like enzyme